MQVFIDAITVIGVILFTISIGVFIVNTWYVSRRYEGKTSDHFDGRYFYNIGWTPRESRRIERFEGKKGGLIYWLCHREKKKWVKRAITTVIPASRINTGCHITDIGHATYLIQTDGLNILTDPVWSNRASPWPWLGPKRYQEPGVRFEDLPPIDIILLSHNHYDHMDISTLRRLYREKGYPTIYTGLGNKSYLKRWGIDTVIEMDWWDVETHGGGIKNRNPETDGTNRITNNELRITFLPAQHFSARGLTDRNRTLWGGFRVEIAGRSLYFAGDTGYGDFAREIRKKYPQGFDIGLIPIGAYKPRWFMAPVHTDPLEGLLLQRDLGVQKAIGIHHSTFDLADDDQDDPALDLDLAKKDIELQDQVFEIGPAGTVWKW